MSQSFTLCFFLLYSFLSSQQRLILVTSSLLQLLRLTNFLLQNSQKLRFIYADHFLQLSCHCDLFLHNTVQLTLNLDNLSPNLEIESFVSAYLGKVEILLELLISIGEKFCQDVESLDEVEASANVGGGLVDIDD